MAEAVHPGGPGPGNARAGGLSQILTPSPPVAYAIRFAVAVSAALWLGNLPGLVTNNPKWILITVLMILQPTTGGFLLKGALRAAGTLAAVLTSIVLFGAFSQDPPLLMVGFFAVQAIAAYGFTGPRFQYAWFVWAFTTAIVLGDAMAGQGAVETVAFQRASMVGLGILVVMATDSLFWHARAEPQLRASLAARAQALAGALRRAVAPGSPAGDDTVAGAGSATLAKQLPMLQAMQMEVGVSRATVEQLRRVALLLFTLASRARALASPADAASPPEGEATALAGALETLARQLAASLDAVAAALIGGRAPEPSSEALERALQAVEAEHRRLPPSAAREGRVAALHDLVSLIAHLEQVATAPDPEWATRARRSLDLQPDPFRVKIALRAGIAVVAAVLTPVILGWGIVTLVAPLAFMAAVLTRGAAVQTLLALATVLALGWLVADLALVYVTPHWGRMPGVLVVPFGLAAAFALLSSGRPALALLPSIGGVVAFLGIFGGPAAPMGVEGPYDTVCYLATGFGVGWLFSRTMWPATAAGLFRKRVGAQLTLCLDAARRAREVGADRRAWVRTLVAGFAEQAVALAPLHQQALREPVEDGLDPERRAQILSLATDLADALLDYRPDALTDLQSGEVGLAPLRQALGEALEALAESLQANVEALRGEAEERPAGRLGAAHAAVEAELRARRERLAAAADAGDESWRRLLVAIDAYRRIVFRQLAIERWLDEWCAAAPS